MAEDYTSLLGRDSNVGFADIASAYLRGGARKNKNMKKLLFASLFYNLREAKMQSNVMKNLEQLTYCNYCLLYQFPCVLIL